MEYYSKNKVLQLNYIIKQLNLLNFTTTKNLLYKITNYELKINIILKKYYKYSSHKIKIFKISCNKFIFFKYTHFFGLV